MLQNGNKEQSSFAALKVKSDDSSKLMKLFWITVEGIQYSLQYNQKTTKSSKNFQKWFRPTV